MDRQAVTPIWLLLLGGLLCGIAVGLGAWVSHGAQALLADAQIDSLRIAVRYQFWHGLALLLFWLIGRQAGVAMALPAVLVTLGVMMFSGSIWLLTVFKQTWLWPVTPIGGSLLLLGWLAFVWSVLRIKS